MNARQLPFHWDVRSAIGREDFLVADSNRDAVIWLDKWPDWPQPALVLSGPEGAGKSHLARVWQKQANAQLIQAASLTLDNVPELALRPLVIEDAEGVRTEQALLHLLNMLREAGLHLLMTARQPPARWQVALPDLRSRLNALPVASLQAPDDSLIAALLVKLFADRQLRVGDDVIEFLVPRMERSFAAAQDLVERLDRTALENRRNITVPLAREILQHRDQSNLKF